MNQSHYFNKIRKQQEYADTRTSSTFFVAGTVVGTVEKLVSNYWMSIVLLNSIMGNQGIVIEIQQECRDFLSKKYTDNIGESTNFYKCIIYLRGDTMSASPILVNCAT
jgi:hypothetical protein